MLNRTTIIYVWILLKKFLECKKDCYSYIMVEPVEIINFNFLLMLKFVL